MDVFSKKIFNGFAIVDESRCYFSRYLQNKELFESIKKGTDVSVSRKHPGKLAFQVVQFEWRLHNSHPARNVFQGLPN